MKKQNLHYIQIKVLGCIHITIHKLNDLINGIYKVIQQYYKKTYVDLQFSGFVITTNRKTKEQFYNALTEEYQRFTLKLNETFKITQWILDERIHNNVFFIEESKLRPNQNRVILYLDEVDIK